jgi:uncharacterized protein (TIGR02996 family)
MASATRYELSEGNSNKFWEIQLEGSSFTTTYGRIGANGQTTSKSFGSPAEAKKEHDKLVAEKTKKGYALVSGKAAAAPAEAPKAEKKEAKAAAPVKKEASERGSASSHDRVPGGGAASASAEGGARYFEFVEGTSAKFWEVTVAGSSCTTRFGKIGTAGQSSTKAFGSPGDANKEANKLVAEKTKKGYVEKSGGPGGGGDDEEGSSVVRSSGGAVVHDARNPELEAAIIADPSDRDAYAVYADWLQEQGDPRGELISLQLGYKDKQARTLIEKHKDYFLGPLAEHEEVYDEGGNNSSSHLRTSAQEKEWQKIHRQAFLWRNGFIYRVRLSHDSYSVESFEGQTVDILKQVLAHPSARFATEFAFMSNGDPNEDNLQDLIDALAADAPPTTRRIILGDNVDQISWHHTGNLEKLWKGVPSLRTIEIETGEFDVGKMDAPSLERAVFITGGLSSACCKNIAKAKIPKIQHLEIYFGSDNYGGDSKVEDIASLLARTDLENLRYLGLKNSEFSDDIARALVDAKILAGLKTLDLSLGTMSDEGARALADAKDKLAHLDVLDLTRNYLTDEGKKLVKGLCAKVITNEQEEGEDDDRYVAISE